MPERLSTPPDTGLVVYAPPEFEATARCLAEQHQCDYILDPWCPPRSVYTLDAGWLRA
jgi:hypothetical protein